MRRFHLIISALLHQYMQSFAEELNLTVGGVIALFVELTINQIDLLYQEYGRQTHSLYEKVDVEGRIDVNIHLTYDTYMQVKWLHGYHNLYSVAQVVRRCVFLMLVLIRRYGSLESAIAALDRLNRVTEDFQQSRDEHGVMHRFMGLIHLFDSSYLSLFVIVEYVVFMLFYLYPPPMIER